MSKNSLDFRVRVKKTINYIKLIIMLDQSTIITPICDDKSGSVTQQDFNFVSTIKPTNHLKVVAIIMLTCAYSSMV